jgi:hypothetical protein
MSGVSTLDASPIESAGDDNVNGRIEIGIPIPMACFALIPV